MYYLYNVSEYRNSKLGTFTTFGTESSVVEFIEAKVKAAQSLDDFILIEGEPIVLIPGGRNRSITIKVP